MNKPDSSSIPIGVVGMGKMGIMHAATATQCPGARVAALIDSNRGAAESARSMGMTDAKYFPTISEAAAGAGIQAVAIAAPSFLHRPLAEEALKAGLHVLTEKPLAHTLADAQAMADAARAHPDRRCAVGFMKGHIAHFTESARLLRAGALGEVRRFHASVYLSQVFSPKKGWTFTKDLSGGGVLINTGIHLVHLCRTLFGMPAAIYCRARPMHSSVEDTLTAIWEYDTGLFGSVDISWSVPGYEFEYTRIVAEGANGTMDLDDFRRRMHLLEPWGDMPMGLSVAHQSENESARFALTPDYAGVGYYHEMADFVASIRESRAPKYTFDDGLEIQRLVDAFYRSAEEGKKVEL